MWDGDGFSIPQKEMPKMAVFELALFFFVLFKDLPLLHIVVEADAIPASFFFKMCFCFGTDRAIFFFLIGKYLRSIYRV